MRKFKVLQKLVEQLRRKEEWADWDFVLEIEQRATDSAPQIRAGYWSWVEVDWGDGNGVQRYTPPNNANGSFTGPQLEPGVYTVKMRMNPTATSTSRYVKFGPDSSDTSSSAPLTNTYLPQLTKVLKADMSRHRSMSYMFTKCNRLTEVCKFTNTQTILSMSYTFNGCTNLEGTVAFDDLKNCGSANFTFWNTQRLSKILLGPMPTCASIANICNKSGMEEIVISDLKACTSTNAAFFCTTRLKKLVIPGGLPKIQNIGSMFAYSQIEEVDIGTYFPDCTTAIGIFQNCYELRDVHGFGRFEKLTSGNQMFQFCKKLTDLSIDLGNVISALQSAFMGCDALSSLTIEGEFDELVYANALCQFDNKLTQITVNGEVNKLPDLPKLQLLSYAFTYTSIAGSFEIGDMPAMSNLTQMFYNDTSLESFKCGDVGGWDEETQTSSAAGCQTTDMFRYCTSLKYFKCGNHNFNILQYMFYSCGELLEAEFGERGYVSKNGHDDDGVNNITQTFALCSSLKHIKGCLKLRRTGPASNTAFNNAFDACMELEEMPDVWPDDGFAATFTYSGAQIQTFMNNCYNMHGHAPEWLWTSSDPRRFKGSGSKVNCFGYCFNLDNHGEIPQTWRNTYALQD